MLNSYKKSFASLISEATQIPLEEILNIIEVCPENISGDLAFPCFQLSKILKKSPNIIAQELAEKLSWPQFVKFEALGWYLNAHINQSNFIENFLTAKPEHIIKPTTKVLIEYMNANPNKPLHIGQARNVCIGDSMRRIFNHLNYTTHAFNYGDDSGVNVGYNIVWHLFYGYALNTDMKYDHYCGKIYETMRKKDEDSEFKQLLSSTLQKIESGDPEIYDIHQTYTRKCTLEQINSCRKIGGSFDGIARETDVLHLKFFAEAMDLLRDKWYVKFVDEGDAKWCWIIDLSSLPAYAKEEKQYQILIKSDGVATYIAKDISFALWKLGFLQKDFFYKTFTHEPDGNIIYTTTSEANEHKNKFWNYNLAITVIDNRQIPSQEIVKSWLKLLGYLSEDKQYSPLGYGVVYLTPQTLTKLWYELSPEELEQKRLPFSSRKWRTVTLDEMMKMLHEKAYRETKERNPGKSDAQLDEIAEKIAVWSLRFFLIKGDISRDIVFDLDEVLNMDGETGAYILYTWARIQSIIDQADKIVENSDYSLLTEKYEFSLVKKIAEFEQIIIEAKEQLAPHLIARFLFELSTLLNSYYAHVKILSAEENIKNARIFLLHTTLEVLKKAMNLIWMHFVERM